MNSSENRHQSRLVFRRAAWFLAVLLPLVGVLMLMTGHVWNHRLQGASFGIFGLATVFSGLARELPPFVVALVLWLLLGLAACA